MGGVVASGVVGSMVDGGITGIVDRLLLRFASERRWGRSSIDNHPR